MPYPYNIPKQPPPMRRRSLVDDARYDSAKNKEVRSKDLKNEDTREPELTEEKILFLDHPDADNAEVISINLVFSVRGSLLDDLANVLNCIKQHDGGIRFLETRFGRQENGKDIFVELSIPRKGLPNLIRSVRKENGVSVSIFNKERPGTPDRENWYPKSIADLNKCTHIEPEPNLDQIHPGFSDPVYRTRRREIANIAFDYKLGEIIPRVDYTDDEIKTWGIVFDQLRSMYPIYACSRYLEAFRLLEDECGYRRDAIPQLQDVSAFLKRRSGFVLRPAAGLVKARDFLSSLAFRVFQCTQYVRHSSSPEHTPEPDCIHELLGHAPMLADMEFAKFSQEIGLASLGATDQNIEKLATVYWFTVEFGLCREKDEVKAYGAGLLSSFGELKHALSGSPRLLPFDPMTTSLHPYQDQDFQDVYFVADTFQDAKHKIRKYVREAIRRPYDIVYDPYTETIQQMDSISKIEEKMDDLASDILALKDAMRRLK